MTTTEPVVRMADIGRVHGLDALGDGIVSYMTAVDILAFRMSARDSARILKWRDAGVSPAIECMRRIAETAHSGSDYSLATALLGLTLIASVNESEIRADHRLVPPASADDPRLRAMIDSDSVPEGIDRYRIADLHPVRSDSITAPDPDPLGYDEDEAVDIMGVDACGNVMPSTFDESSCAAATARLDAEARPPYAISTSPRSHRLARSESRMGTGDATAPMSAVARPISETVGRAWSVMRARPWTRRYPTTWTRRTRLAGLGPSPRPLRGFDPGRLADFVSDAAYPRRRAATIVGDSYGRLGWMGTGSLAIDDWDVDIETGAAVVGTGRNLQRVASAMGILCDGDGRAR